MKELKKNLWDCKPTIVITTNGFVKKDGEAVMGRGCALEAVKRYPVLSLSLGKKIKWLGNHVYYLGKYPLLDKTIAIFSFPVKHVWYGRADIKLIERSAEELLLFMDSIEVLLKTFSDEIYIVRPGCGNGRLDWEREVRPVLEKIWDDRFIVVHL